ncbi:acyltransferase family protein [Streptococcus constellatus]|uniref:acyltransferase family protein n=1 Tax=Streptococcus constellatus TaxID=76860 RepID=UPI00210257ED|nr:acyltransferase family protein [Streptococcus constellatus]UTX64514.1 acetyltransferase [Streptococcus constellatus]
MRVKWFSLVRITGLLLVLLYHFFQKAFPGGFIGVDIFFTFSGFLITSLLIDEFARNKGIDIKGFLRRRFYRIVPPLVLMILVVMPFTLLIRRDFVAGIGTQIAAAFGFMTNFYEILSGGNYESQFIPHLFVHTWSLALEMHYYILWGLATWYLAKKSKNVGQFRGVIFLVSSALFFISFLSMFVRGFFSSNFSVIYFSSFTHIFPFFVGSVLATVSGVSDLGAPFHKIEQALDLKKTFYLLGGSFVTLLLLTFLLRFDNLLTYLFGFLLATVFSVVMILATRVLHEKTPHVDEPPIITFIADTSYGVYLFHWPFYIIFSQLMSNGLAVLLTTILSFVFAAGSFYLLEPTLAGKEPKVFGLKMNIKQITTPVFYSLIPFTLITLIIMMTAPQIGAFEENLLVNGLNQADNKMQITRTQVDHATASQYNVTKGTTVIGDSVALRASEWLKQAMPEAQVDAAVSRNLASGLEVYQTDISNKVLLENVVLALGANTVDNYESLLNQFIAKLPKGHRLILVTPYDGRTAHDGTSIAVKTRQYELELAKKYDYVFVADWYQVAIEHPEIWYGTDYVHFGSESTTITKGGELYAQTVKQTIEEATKKGTVKK